MNHYILHLIAFLSFLSVNSITAQEHYAFSHIESNDGLSENNISCITQLEDGRMVIVTEGLVNLFNGTSFKYHHFNDEQIYKLSGYNGYHRTYVGNDELLWIKNRQKLLVFDIRRESFMSDIDTIFKKQGINTGLKDFFMDTDYNYWYLTNNDQLILHNRKEGEAGRVFLSNVSWVNEKHDELYDLSIRDDQLFLFYKSGIMCCYNLNTSEKLYCENPFGDQENPYTNTLQVVAHAQFLYQIRSGSNIGAVMHRFNVKSRKWDKIIEVQRTLNTLTVDRNGDCWVSSHNGIWFIDKHLIKKRHIPQLQLVDGRVFKSVIHTQYSDRDGGLWIGTSNRGVLYYHPERFKFLNFGRTLFGQLSDEELNVKSFCSKDNYIWVGTQQGLFRYKQNAANRLDANSLTRYLEIPVDAVCEMLWKDTAGRIWICTSNGYGLYCLDDDRITQYSFPFSSIYCMYETIEGRLLIGTDKGFGFVDILTGTYERLDIDNKPTLNTVYQLIGYGQNRLLGLSSKGIFTYDFVSDILYLPTLEEDNRLPIFSQSSHQYNSLFIDSRGLIWVGSQDGLFVWNADKERSHRFFTENGLVNNVIKSITEDLLHRIWVSTSCGISCIEVTPDDLSFRYSFRNFNHYDGIIEHEFLPRSVFLTENGKLFWGGLEGFNELDYTELYIDSPPLSTPLFVAFFLFGLEVKQGEEYNENTILKQSLSSTKELVLKHNQNFIGFEFSALNYVNPTQTFYRFKLEGIDDAWREMTTIDGMGRLNYTNLPPGNYLLKVYAANNSYNWSEEYAEMKILILPPFWKTPIAYICYLVFILCLIYLSAYTLYRKNKERLNRQQKEELDQLKFRFFTNISHELRTPLTLILAPLDLVINRVTDQKTKSQLESIQRNTNNLLFLVNQLLDFRKLEMNGEDLNLSNCYINEFINSVGKAFEEVTSNRGVFFSWTVSPRNISIYVDQDKLRKIINNLLSNACKFTPKGGHIYLIVSQVTSDKTSETMLKIEVRDTGCGISGKDLPYIFNRFYQVKLCREQNTGSGIGLHLTQEYVQLHNGRIEVESEPGNGSVFTVYIPSNLRPANQKVLSLEPEMPEIVHPLKVLVVEDNDEFRSFLCNELSESYTILEASNGIEGFKTAMNDLPDLIISDVMMPEMSGLELCEKLKKEISTSHIPVILLTARASEKTQLEGYEAGADAYIPKPFNMDILLIRIQHLIEQQEQRKELFKKALIIYPESVTSTHIDEKLVKKALQCIEKNMANPSYSVEQFSKDMCMDRTGLYRKLIAIVGQTPTAFIRTVRLKRATQLLDQGLPVSEVADLVGFSTVSYFSKCFQDEFRVKPSQYKT